MDPHRPLGDRQLPGDAPVGQAAGQQEEHLALAGGEGLEHPRVRPSRPDVGRTDGEALQQTAGRRGRHDRVAGVDMVDRGHELLQGGVLEEEAPGAGADRLEGVLIEVEGRQHQDPGSGGPRRDPAGRLDAVHPRHAHVHEDDVGLHAGDQFDGRPAVLGLADHLHLLAGLQQHAESEPVHLLVVDQDDPDGHAPSRVRTGRTARRANPPPGRGPALRVPPWAAIRSRMPVRPYPGAAPAG